MNANLSFLSDKSEGLVSRQALNLSLQNYITHRLLNEKEFFFMGRARISFIRDVFFTMEQCKLYDFAPEGAGIRKTKDF